MVTLQVACNWFGDADELPKELGKWEALLQTCSDVITVLLVITDLRPLVSY